jgi:quercetin dioxygenase-like cupin family protein
VTAGKGKIAGDGETIAVTAGDAILINPNEKHQIINSGDEPLEFICIIPNGKEDRIK